MVFASVYIFWWLYSFFILSFKNVSLQALTAGVEFDFVLFTSKVSLLLFHGCWQEKGPPESEARG